MGDDTVVMSLARSVNISSYFIAFFPSLSCLVGYITVY